MTSPKSCFPAPCPTRPDLWRRRRPRGGASTERCVPLPPRPGWLWLVGLLLLPCFLCCAAAVYNWIQNWTGLLLPPTTCPHCTSHATPPCHHAQPNRPPQLFWRACRRYVNTWNPKKVREEQAARTEDQAEAEQQRREAEGPTLAEDFGEPSCRCCCHCLLLLLLFVASCCCCCRRLLLAAASQPEPAGLGCGVLACCKCWNGAGRAAPEQQQAGIRLAPRCASLLSLNPSCIAWVPPHSPTTRTSPPCAAAAAAKGGHQALKPWLAHMYQSRARSYKDAVQQFVEGYKQVGGAVRVVWWEWFHTVAVQQPVEGYTQVQVSQGQARGWGRVGRWLAAGVLFVIGLSLGSRAPFQMAFASSQLPPAPRALPCVAGLPAGHAARGSQGRGS